MHMKLRLSTPALLVMLAACTTAGDPPPDAAAVAPSDEVLTGHHWLLDTATGPDGARIDALFPGTAHPLALDFAEGRLRASGGCNGASGMYRLESTGQLEVGALASTRMACDEPLMRVDRAVAELLSGAPLQLRLESGTPPRLVLQAADGTESTWTGEPTAETRYGGPGDRMFLEVAPRRIDCNHPLIPDHQCLQVREVQYDPSGIRQPTSGEWQPLYAQIEGFEFVEGERKVLRVKRFERDPAPADASSIVYVLDMVVEASRAGPAP